LTSALSLAKNISSWQIIRVANESSILLEQHRLLDVEREYSTHSDRRQYSLKKENEFTLRGLRNENYG